MFGDFSQISASMQDSFIEDPSLNENGSNKDIQKILLPSRIITGKGAIDQVSETLKKLGLDKTTYIITGNKTFDIAGKYVCEKVEESGIRCKVYKASEASPEEIEKI